MSYFLLFLLIVFVILILIFRSGGRLFVAILRLLFGRSMASPNGSFGQRERGDYEETDSKRKGKVFAKEEGEYVDFEDVDNKE